MRYVFVIAFLVAFVGLSLVTDRVARVEHSVTGTITAWRAGQSITVSNEYTDPAGIEMTLRSTTTYDGDKHRLNAGALVTVWYRSVGERRPIAERVLVLGAP